MSYVVYALEDPIAGDVRYVGVTDDPDRRFRDHLRECRRNSAIERNSAINAWIRQVLASGQVPIMRILEEVGEDNARQRESYWIAYYIKMEASLANALSNFSHKKVRTQRVIVTRPFEEADFQKTQVLPGDKYQLRRVRAMLGLSQAKLAELSGLSAQTILDAERGKRQIRLTSAYAILRVLNELRRQEGLAELDIDSLDWNVEGD